MSPCSPGHRKPKMDVCLRQLLAKLGAHSAERTTTLSGLEFIAVYY